MNAPMPDPIQQGPLNSGSTQSAWTFEELLAGACADQLEEAQWETLEEMLLNHPERQQEYLAAMDLHHSLRQLASSSQVKDVPLPVRPQTTESSLSVRQKIHGSVWQYAPTLLILLVACGFFFSQWSSKTSTHDPSTVSTSPTSTQNSFATLTAKHRAEFLQPVTPVLLDQALSPNMDYVLSQGIVGLTFGGGAEVIVEGPALFRILDDKSMILAQGDCSVHAPPGAQGFSVETPQGKVVDLGTRFSLSVSETGQGELFVVEGVAEILDPRAPEKLLLTKGQGGVISYEQPAATRDVPSAHPYRETLPDRVIRYTALPGPDGFAEEVESITLQRDGEVRTYQADALTRSAVTGMQFSQEQTGRANCLILPFDTDLEHLPGFGDYNLDLAIGWINPLGQVSPLSRPTAGVTPGMEITFERPVVNGPGPDLVVFDLHVVTHPQGGDPFHILPLDSIEGLHPFTVQKYDLDLTCENALQITKFRLSNFRLPSNGQPFDQPPTDLVSSNVHAVPAKALAVAIDLTDLGYPPGASASKIFIQDADNDENRVDPVVIVGLP